MSGITSISTPLTARNRLGAASTNGASEETVAVLRAGLAEANLAASIRRAVDAARRYLSDDDIAAVIESAAGWPPLSDEKKAALALSVGGES